MSKLSRETLWATAAAVATLSWVLCSAVRNLYFHPLSSVPGPWFNCISEIPATVALVTGNQHLCYQRLHKKYGPVVRVSPDEVSFISLQAREEIHNSRKGGQNMEKSPIFLGSVSQLDGQTGVSLAVGLAHSRQRRALGYLFTNSALLKHESIIQSHIEKLMQIFVRLANSNDTVNCADWYTYVAFDILGDLCFAEPFGCLSSASETDWSTSVINTFISATWTQGIRRIAGVGTYLEILLSKALMPASAAQWRTTHLEKSREKTLRRLADRNRNHKDFMYHILQNDSRKSLTETEIVLNMASVISAGSDTTATALTGWTYFICTHPDVYKRIAAEVRSLSRKEDIRWENVKNLHYLEATIKETLRLYPPSPASQQRLVPEGGATIDGYFISAGKTVAIAPWVATHSELNFHEPTKFRPERWLFEDEAFALDKLGVSLPFGTGPRVCIGKNLAYMEMQLITAHLLWNFDLHLDLAGHKEENRVWGLDGEMQPFKIFHSMTKPPLWVKIIKRQGLSNVITSTNK